MDVRTVVDLMRRNVWKEGGVLEGQCLSFCPTRNLTQATSEACGPITQYEYSTSSSG